MNWDDVRLFLAIAQEGSFRKAADTLKLGHSTLSRRIEALERDLDTRLFNRLSHGLSLTNAGQEMLRTAQPMGRDFDGLQVRMFGQDGEAKGRIRVTTPLVLMKYLLIKPIHKFCGRWPEIHIELDTSCNILDLSAMQADIALRITNHPSDQLIGRKVGVYCEAAYASLSYLNWFSTQTRKRHRWVFPGGGYEFVAQLDKPYTTSTLPQPCITIQDVDAQMEAACEGVGLAMLPCLMGDPNPDLRRISSVVQRSEIWLLSHRDSRNNKRMQLFRDVLTHAFEGEQDRLFGLLEN
ncbi:MAG: LysR family transcriptional regulator [Gammaproteobacteria bacterium]|nr:LysR family transcriptional regulator [Gammaproteobacteria bacterium]